MKLSFIKILLGAVIIAWYVLPFVFFQTHDRLHEYGLRHPFITGHSCGPEEVFCFIFGLILRIGDVGLALLGLNWIIYELAYGREERRKEKKRKEELEHWEKEHGIVKRLADKPVSWKDRLFPIAGIVFLLLIPATGYFLMTIASSWAFDICDFFGWIVFGIGAFILIHCAGFVCLFLIGTSSK